MGKAREVHERRGDKKLVQEIDKNIEDVEEQEKMSDQLDKEMN